MNLEEGRLIGNRYEIEKRIGVGGMATVYKARDTILNRNVAVKVLREEFTTDSEFIKRFNTEAQSAASLTHPNIVSVYDVGNEGNLYYIVMELISGKTLKDIINADGMLPWKWSVNIAMQIASALDAAHRNNIIHRDIKPHNIIITEEGVAKVTDFGIAKAVSNSTITAFGTTIGSVHYFSPEHAKGGFTDAKSDIYSLGVVMYEMLTGKVPFDADTPVSVALKHMQEDPEEPINKNNTIPSSLNKIIIKAMKKDPMQRYSSATEMLVDLKSVIRNPNEDIVVVDKNDDKFATRKIEGINNLNNKVKKDDKKKNKKFGEFLNEHKFIRAILFLLLAIIIFFGTIILTYNIMTMLKPKEVQIPSLIGVKREEAILKIQELNLVVEETEEYNKDIEAGLVISQEPPYMDNYTVLEESTVKIKVSKGRQIVKVPYVAGKTVEEAEIALKTEGLVPEIVEENNKKIEAGYVIKQEPVEDSEVDYKSTVIIYVSKGIKTTIVPDLTGKTEEEAKTAITEAKLKIGIVKKSTDMTKKDGVVINQSEEIGKEIEEDLKVDITINEIPKISKGTLNINLKTLTGYTEILDENSIAVPVETATVTVKVNDDPVYEKDHKKDTANISVPIEGIGTVEIEILVSGIVKKKAHFDLTVENPVLTIQ